jgi:hypothetical protein
MTRWDVSAERIPLEVLLDFDKRILWRGQDTMPQDRHMPRPDDQENTLVWIEAHAWFSSEEKGLGMATGHP